MQSIYEQAIEAKADEAPVEEEMRVAKICPCCGGDHEEYEHAALREDDGSGGGGAGGSFVTTGTKWGESQTAGTNGGIVTWSIATLNLQDSDGNTITRLADFMPAGFEADIQAAFDAWEAVADIRFVRVDDGGGVFDVDPVADIRIGGEAIDGVGNVLGRAFFAGEFGTFTASAGDIVFDTAEDWLTGTPDPANGTSVFQVALHEIGHSLGLDHTAADPAIMEAILDETLTEL